MDFTSESLLAGIHKAVPTLKGKVARFLSNVLAGLRSLKEQRNRSLLSALGITVGSMAIVLLISIAKGVQQDIGGQIEDLGVNLLVVLPGRVEEGAMFAPNIAGVSYLKDEHIEDVLQVQGVRTAAPLMFVGGGISRGDNTSPSTFIISTSPEWFKVRPVQMSEGHPFREGELQRPVAVIGSIAKRALFGDGAAVGRTVDIYGTDFEVVGVTEDKVGESSLMSFGSFANVAYIPYPWAKQNIPNPQLHRIMIQTAPDVEPKQLVSAVEATLSRDMTRQMFSVLTQEDLLNLVYKVMNILTWLLSGLTSIALFVGGVGIMTVMLMSVNERAKEIGIRKTAGATRKDVFQQFLTEAVTVSLFGALVGLGLSVIVTSALTAWTPIKPVVSADIIATALGASVLIGGAFGLIPALNAARKDPVVALRAE